MWQHTAKAPKSSSSSAPPNVCTSRIAAEIAERGDVWKIDESMTRLHA